MAKVDIALGGFSQVPDEHTGPPRITRLMNCKFDNGVIKKSHGTAVVSTTSIGVPVSHPITCGVLPSGIPFMVSKRGSYAFDAPEVFVGEDNTSGTVWSTGEINSTVLASAYPLQSQVEYEECPTVSPVFTDPGYHYENPGIVTVSESALNSSYMVVAQALPNWTGDSGSFGSAKIVFAKVSGSDMSIIHRGTQALSLSDGVRPHLACAANSKFFACYYSASTVYVFSLHPTTNLLTGNPYSAPTVATRGNLDLSYDAGRDRLLLLYHTGAYVFINASTGAVLHSGTLSLTDLVQGTQAAALVQSGSDTKAYVVFRNSTYFWKYQTFTFTDSGVTADLAATTLCDSIAFTDPSYFRWQASVVPFSGSVSGSTSGAIAALWWKPKEVLGLNRVYGTVRAMNASGKISQDTIGFDMFSAFPACAPIAHYPSSEAAPSNFHATIWGYQQWRTLRSCIRLGQTRVSYVCSGETGTPSKKLPRLIGTAFRGGTTPPTPSAVRVGRVNAAVQCKLPPNEHGIMRNGHMAAVLRQKSALPVDGVESCDVYLVSQAYGIGTLDTVSNLTDSLQQTTAHGATLLSSAIPSQIGRIGEDSGHNYPPWTPRAASSGSGLYPEAGVYSYVVVREWVDSNGNVHRSPPSDTVTLNHNGGSIVVSCYDDPWQRNYRSCKLRLYRTQANGTVYYEVASDSGCGFDMPAVTAFSDVTITDATRDSAIASNPILYTQAEHGGLSGMLETWGAPGCRFIWAGVDRVIAGGLESPNRVQLSNLFFPGEGISWPENAAFFVDLPERVTAVAYFSGVWIAASENAIWAITGQGPDAFGVGTFDPPRLISSTVGVRSWRSLVEAPTGLYFQAKDGQIYLIQGGSLGVTMASAPIRDSVDQQNESVGVSNPQYNRLDDPSPFFGNYVRCAVYNSYTREVWFALYSGRILVLSLDTNSWRAEVDATLRQRITIGGGETKVKIRRYPYSDYVSVRVPAFIQADDALTIGSQYVFRPALGFEENAYLGYGGDVRQMAVYSNDIDLVHGRLRKIWVTLRREQSAVSSDHTVKGRVGIWYDGKTSALDPGAQMSVVHNAISANSVLNLDLEFCPSRQKCNAFRLYYQDDPAAYPNMSWIITGISVDVEGFDRKQQRIPSIARGVT